MGKAQGRRFQAEGIAHAKAQGLAPGRASEHWEGEEARALTDTEKGRVPG